MIQSVNVLMVLKVPPCHGIFSMGIQVCAEVATCSTCVFEQLLQCRIKCIACNCFFLSGVNVRNFRTPILLSVHACAKQFITVTCFGVNCNIMIECLFGYVTLLQGREFLNFVYFFPSIFCHIYTYISDGQKLRIHFYHSKSSAKNLAIIVLC